MTDLAGDSGEPAGISIVFDEEILRADLAGMREDAHGAIAELRFRLERYGMTNSTLRPLQLEGGGEGRS